MGEQKKGFMIIGDIPLKASLAAITDGESKVEVMADGNMHELFRLFEGICQAIAKAAIESYKQPYESREELDHEVIKTMTVACIRAVVAAESEAEKDGEE